MKQLNLFKFPKKDVGKNYKVVSITSGRKPEDKNRKKVVPILRIHIPREERLEKILHSGKNDSAGKDQWD
jgi:hypothetical protein